MPVNVERIIERADAQLRQAEGQQLARLRDIVNRAYRDLEAEIRRRWPAALAEANGMPRTFAEARARVLLQQLEAYMQALQWGTASTGVPGIMRDVITLGQQAGGHTAAQLLAAFDPTFAAGLAIATARIDFRAVEAALTNTEARLARYSADAIRGIELSVVDGLVRGEGGAKVARRIRDVLRGDGRSPDAGLYAQAKTIARTELANARHLATDARYADANVDLVQWYATLDERTCRYCAARHGKVYRRGEVTLPAHPNCRCWLAPFRPDWVELGLVDTDYWRGSRAEIDELVPDQVHGRTPFEAADDRPAPTAVWTPGGGWMSA